VLGLAKEVKVKIINIKINMTLPKLTHQQQEIIKLQYQYRFLSSTQIQKYLNHKNKGRINSWLPDLVEKKYLQRIYDPSTFWKNTQPAVYYLGINGIRWLKIQAGYDSAIITKIYREKDRSDTFITTCQLVADICLDLKTQSNNSVSFDWATENIYTSPESPYYFSGIFSELRPLLIFSRKVKDKNDYYILDILKAKLPAYRTRKRIRSYLEFLTESEWVGHFQTPPQILLICETKDLLIRSKRYTKKLLTEAEEENVHLSFAQEEEIRKNGVTAEVWEDI
jgi:hypothetical protein